MMCYRRNEIDGVHTKAPKAFKGKVATFKVTDADGDVRKDIYTATDIQKVDADRIQRSPITIAPRSTPRRPRTRQRAAVSLRQGAPRRSARLAGR